MESFAPVNPDRRARYALTAVWLIAAWVLAGAVFKLGWGTPALLPDRKSTRLNSSHRP